MPWRVARRSSAPLARRPMRLGCWPAWSPRGWTWPASISRTGAPPSTVDAPRRCAERRARAGRNVAILQDLQGPKLRLGVFAEGRVELVAGDSVLLVTRRGVVGSPRLIPVPLASLARDCSTGDPVLLDDGRVRLRVRRRRGADVEAEVEVGGPISDHKGVSLPRAAVSVPAFTPKDRRDAALGRALGVDLVAMSFVRIRPGRGAGAPAPRPGHATHRQDGEAAGHRGDGGDRPHRGRGDGRAGRPRRRAPAGAGAGHPEAAGAPGQRPRAHLHRGDGDAGEHDPLPSPHPRRGLGRGQRGAGRRGRGDALGRDRGGTRSGRGGGDDGPDHRGGGARGAAACPPRARRCRHLPGHRRRGGGGSAQRRGEGDRRVHRERLHRAPRRRLPASGCPSSP